MTFYVYENWRADDKAVVHRADCSFCNSGKGTGRGTLGEVNGKWHGPFESKEEAFCYAKSLNRKKTCCCATCLS